MSELSVNVRSFEQAELRSEKVRVAVLLAALVGLLALALFRVVGGLAQGRRDEAWPFAVMLGLMIGYEAAWLVFIRRALDSARKVSGMAWKAGAFMESLLPTAALFLQIHSSTFGPRSALTSPVVLAYSFFIILSTLHLDAGFRRHYE